MTLSKKLTLAGGWVLLPLAAALFPGLVQAKPGSVSAGYAAGKLTVSVKTTDTEAVLFDDVMDQELARSAVSGGMATFTLAQLPTVPCRVRVESGNEALVKSVKGADCKVAKTPPTCRIVQPSTAQSVANGGTLSFKGNVSGAKSRYLTYEWDFGGGADARSTKLETGPIKFNFAHDTRLWVTFAASDITSVRCADRVQIAVGTPPTNLPAKVPEQAAMKGDGQHVVIPFQPYGMAFHDLSYGLYSQITP